MIDVERTDLGRIAVDEDVLTHIVREAAASVDGVHAVRGRSGQPTVDAERAVTVTIGVTCVGGVVLPDVARRVQAEIGKVVSQALDPSALRVDVAVEEVAG
jgi:uncharacterized alkaline shock family protein YloU